MSKQLLHHLDLEALIDINKQFINTVINAFFPLIYKDIYNSFNNCIFILC